MYFGVNEAAENFSVEHWMLFNFFRIAKVHLVMEMSILSSHLQTYRQLRFTAQFMT